MDRLKCYICNCGTKLRNSIRIKATTKYSGTGVHEIIQSFLKRSQILRFSPNDVICEQCFEKLNQYDLACRMADEIQQEVTTALHLTEQEYLNAEPVEYLEDYQKDFQEFQENYDKQHCAETPLQSTDIDNNSVVDLPINEQVEISIEAEENTKPHAKSAELRIKRHTNCEDCDISFITKKELKQHQLHYHMPKKCGVCQKMFANQMELKAHARQDHEIENGFNDETEVSCGSSVSNEGNVRCDICGVQESSEESLLQHVALHENQFKCVVCGTKLKHKANLVLHMRIHTDKKFFKCDKCEKTFVHKSSLRMHLQTTHTNVRNKQCPECPFKFKTTSQLNQHLVSHSGIKKHECPVCGKAFGQKYNMTAHYRAHFLNRIQRKTIKSQPESATA